ncbi:hypothetical protein L596_011241 [Steinernema carpocapsae]|uniref:Uncharacterized protein n=1 Tax=Steinernema carpocapsae TaxID=34508 RepID=A0A4U5NT85_STECR|nr:hypothetical protein L596_011241 [Steinernema carpocapsae]
MVEVNVKHLLLRLLVLLVHVLWFVAYVVQWSLSGSMSYAFNSTTVSWVAGVFCALLTLYSVILFGILLVVRKVVMFTFARILMSALSFIAATLMIACHDHVVILAYLSWLSLLVEVVSGRAANHTVKDLKSSKVPKSEDSLKGQEKKPKTKKEPKSKISEEPKSNEKSREESKSGPRSED